MEGFFDWLYLGNLAIPSLLPIIDNTFKFVFVKSINKEIPVGKINPLYTSIFFEIRIAVN